MAANTYYFFFSLILVFGVLFHLTNVMYFRASGKTILGNKYRSGTPEYQTLQRLSSTRNMAIVLVLALLFAANLAFDIYRILHLREQGYSHFILIFAPVSLLLLALVIFATSRDRLRRIGKRD